MRWFLEYSKRFIAVLGVLVALSNFVYLMVIISWSLKEIHVCQINLQPDKKVSTLRCYYFGKFATNKYNSTKHLTQYMYFSILVLFTVYFQCQYNVLSLFRTLGSILSLDLNIKQLKFATPGLADEHDKPLIVWWHCHWVWILPIQFNRP